MLSELKTKAIESVKKHVSAEKVYYNSKINTRLQPGQYWIDHFTGMIKQIKEKHSYLLKECIVYGPGLIEAHPAECVEYMASYAFAASIKEVLFYYAAESGVHSFMPNEVLKDLNKLGYFDSFEWCNNDSIKVKIIDENDLGFDYDEYLLAKKDDVYILLHRTDIQM